MTAIIGILNKSAVAIAADSAVTVGGGVSSKIYNNANKIFNLHIGKPIGVMIYNSAEFAGVPWETIIKQYRLKAKTSGFKKTYEYRDDLIHFLKSFQKRYTLDNEETTVVDFTIKVLNFIEDELDIITSSKEDANLSPKELKSFCKGELAKLISSYTVSAKKNEKLEDLQGLDYNNFNEINKKRIEDISKQFLSIYNLEADSSLLASINKLIYESFIREIFLEPWTGLVFTGFGEDEIFPSLYSIKIGGMVSGKIRHATDRESVVIDNENPATIAPFAQTDIMRTFVEGIDPFVRDSIPQVLESVLNEFRKFIMGSLDFSNEKEKNLDKVLEKNIPKVVSILVERLEELRVENHINPMLSTINSLSKEDLTEMAESLINLTYLKRRASFGEESVGGPVDVAVITKGDGFIWIKRKHYFKPELNLNYISKSRM